MSRHQSLAVLFVFALTAPGRAPAGDAVAPDWTPGGLVAQLQSADAKVRRVAAARLRNLDGTHLDTIEQASARQDLPMEARDSLKAALPALRARARRLKLADEVRQYELRLSLETYERTGAKDPRWDALVREAMNLFAGPERAEPARVAAAFRKAVEAGCTDPLVQFLYARSDWLAGPAERDASLARLRAAALAMPASKHPAEYTWRAAVRYLEQSNGADQEVINVALQALPKALAETGRPNRDIADSVDVLHEALTRATGVEEEAFDQIYPMYAKSRPATDPGPYVYKGRWHITWGWKARGSDWAQNVTPQGWKLLVERLAVAREALEKAWAIDPQDERAPADMIRVIMGEGGSKAEMEMWFRRATGVNPDDRRPYAYKLTFLAPRWMGSPAEMLVFGRQCLATQNYWPPVPTILADAHEELSRCGPMDPKEYLAQPEVWADVEAVYRSFLDIYPESRRTPWYRNKLAKWACDCGQWDAARSVFAEIGDAPDLTVFRSQAVYDYYRRKAKRLSPSIKEVSAEELYR